MNPPTEAQVILERVCSRTGKVSAPPVRHLRVSLVRRCPKCRSRFVQKQARRRYHCNECRHEFMGIRIGVFRFAR